MANTGRPIKEVEIRPKEAEPIEEPTQEPAKEPVPEREPEKIPA